MQAEMVEFICARYGCTPEKARKETSYTLRHLDILHLAGELDLFAPKAM